MTAVPDGILQFLSCPIAIQVYHDGIVHLSDNCTKAESCCSLCAVDIQVYHEGIVRLSDNCARAAARCHVKMYIEMSSGQMLSSEKVGTCFLLRLKAGSFYLFNQLLFEGVGQS